MKSIEIEVGYYGLPCAVRKFVIDGIEADEDDFGESVSEGDGCGGCINRHFEGNINPFHIKEMCNKYNLTHEEYLKIVERLEYELDIGDCGWCQ